METTIGVLYIDDSPAFLETLGQTLSAGGYRVKLAINVNEALSHLQESSFDVIIIDYLMPELTGAEVLKLLKERASQPQKTRYFLYTTDTAAHLSCSRFGFDGAFTLKGNPESLLAQLEPVARLIRLKRMRGLQ
jgi:CheY-like chemotaxis protein